MSRRMLIETANFDKGGLEKVILESAVAFKARGYDVAIISDGILGEMAESAKNRGIHVVQIKGKIHLLFFLLRFKPGICMSHFSYFGYKVYRILKIPNVTFIHNVYAFFSEEQKKDFRKYDKYVSRYISVSREAANYIKNNYGISGERISLVPNGLNTSKEAAKSLGHTDLSRKDFGLSQDDFVFLNVAAYNLHKGHFLMVNSIAEVIKIRPKTKIICLGNPVYKPHFEILQKYVKEVGVQGNILFLGQHSDLTWFYQNSNAFLLPSFIEGWSMAMNEAMYYQLPMILTKVGGAPEVVYNNDIGILIPSFFKERNEYDWKDLNSLAYIPQQYDNQNDLKIGRAHV